MDFLFDCSVGSLFFFLLLLFIVYAIYNIKQVLTWILIIGALIICIKYYLIFWIPAFFLALLIWCYIGSFIKKFIVQLRNKHRHKKILRNK